MPRVLLINPPSPERLRAPLLGQQYLAASLLARGHEVRVVDAAASHFEGADDAILEVAEAFDPELVGIALFTRWIWHAYRLLDELRGRFPLLVGGGPHASVRPQEVIARGCDIAASGEGEHVLAMLAECAVGRHAIDTIPGLHYRGAGGNVLSTAQAIRFTRRSTHPHAAASYSYAWG